MTPEEREEKRRAKLKERKKRLEEREKVVKEKLKKSEEATKSFAEKAIEEAKAKHLLKVEVQPYSIEERKKDIMELINKTPRNETLTVKELSEGLKERLRKKILTLEEYKKLRDFTIEEMKKAGYTDSSIKRFESFTPLPMTT